MGEVISSAIPPPSIPSEKDIKFLIQINSIKSSAVTSRYVRKVEVAAKIIMTAKVALNSRSGDIFIKHTAFL